MPFNPDNYDLKKLSEYPQIAFGNDLPDAAFVPVVSLDENDALANYKISLAQIRDFIIQNGDYTNVIDYRPQNYAEISGKQLIIPAGWRLECPNGFLPTGEFQNEIVNITDPRTVEFSQVTPGLYVVFVTATAVYIVLKNLLLVRKQLSQVQNPTEGVICYETDNNLWHRWTSSNWQQITGMPLLNVNVTSDEITVSLCASLMRNRLNLEYLLAQAGFEIPESRGPFERVITNVKKTGTDLLYYIPAHTEVDLTNYPATLDLIKAAYARAITTTVRRFAALGRQYSFYRDPQTGLDFIQNLDDYAACYSALGLAPFIYFDNASTIWTPKTSHGNLIYKLNSSNNVFIRIYADGWCEQSGWNIAVSIPPDWQSFRMEYPYPFLHAPSVSVQPVLDVNYADAYFCRMITTTDNNRYLHYYMILNNAVTKDAPPITYRATGFVDISNFPNSESHNEYYLLGNAVTNIPMDLQGQLGTILNDYNQIVQQGANFFSIQAANDADALAKSQQNPTKFVFVADS